MGYIRFWLIRLLPVILLAGACQPITDSTAAQPRLQLVGHVSGSALSIAVQGDYAYLGFSYELVVLNLADRSNPHWVTSLPLPANDITVDGQRAAVVGLGGFTLLDLSEPSTPVVLGRLPLAMTPTGVAMIDAYAYVVGEARLHIIDLADAQTPTLLTWLSLPKRLEGITVQAGAAYITADTGLYIVDVADPRHPIQLSLLAGAPADGAPVLVGEQLYFGSGGQVQIVDVADPSKPQLVAQADALTWVSELAVVEGYLYVANGNQGLRVLDATDLAQIVERGRYLGRGLVTDVAVQDGYVYLLDCDEGLRIFAAANPTHLREIGTFRTLGITVQAACAGDGAYVIAGWNCDLHRIACTDPHDVLLTTAHIANGYVYDLATSGDYLYMVNPDGLQIINIAVPHHPVLVGSYPGADLWQVAIADHYIYLSDSKGNLWVLDGADPVNLVEIARYEAIGYAGSMVVADGRAYLPDRKGGMQIMIITQNGELLSTGLYPLPYMVNSIAIYQHFAYLAIGRAGIQIVDVADPAAPLLAGVYNTPGDVRDIAIERSSAFVADGPAGLRVLDLRDPLHPREVATYATLDYARQVVSANGLIYVADRLGGLYLLALTPSP